MRHSYLSSYRKEHRVINRKHAAQLYLQLLVDHLYGELFDTPFVGGVQFVHSLGRVQ